MLHHDGSSFTMDAGAGLGVSFGVGDSEFTVGGGIGLGFKMSRNSTEIIESISLTDDEADLVNNQSRGNSCWGLANKTDDLNDDGFYEANVTIDVGDHQTITDIKVFSADGNVWMSINYQTEAIKAEQED